MLPRSRGFSQSRLSVSASSFSGITTCRQATRPRSEGLPFFCNSFDIVCLFQNCDPFLSAKGNSCYGAFSSLFVPSSRPMNMHFETAGSARTPADEPTTAGRLHPGADRAACRSDGGRLSIEARRSALIGPTAGLIGEINRSHSFVRAAPNPTGAASSNPSGPARRHSKVARRGNEEGNFSYLQSLEKSQNVEIISPVM